MDEERVILAHGEGGLATKRLIENIFAKKFSNPILNRFEDSAIIKTDGKKAFTVDAFIVEPIFFPGGDIGKLSVAGTINDLAAMGAKPKYFSASFVIEEGLKISDLEKVADSMAKTLNEVGAEIVAADTKVVPKGHGGGIYITTAAVGNVIIDVGIDRIVPGDVVVLSGDIARHGAAILAARENIETDPPLNSDCAQLWGLVEDAIISGAEIHAMRDPTRGGLATVLVEIAERAGLGIEIDENAIPIKEQVKALCELYGFDPLYMANEGKMVFFVAENDAEKLLSALKRNEFGNSAAIIGKVTRGKGVILRTKIGGRRKLIMLEGEQLPRIC